MQPNADPSPRVRYEAAVLSGAIIEEGRNWHLSSDEIAKRFPALRSRALLREPETP